MPTPNTDANSAMDAESGDFVLKHRVVGAAVILFFGALVLPWLLGAPSEARKNADAQAIPKDQQDLAIDRALREELLASLEAEQEQPADQVYVSKITPLSRLSDGGLSKEVAVTSTMPTPTTETKPAPPVTGNKPAERSTASVTNKVTEVKVENKKPVVKSPETKQVEPAKPKPEEKLAANKPITVGWIVQVGVFTDKNGVARVLEDLRGKGFSPSTTVVDTNRGKNTGTRIWLGPFEQRVQAAQMITRLADKTGEAGFIRAYP